MFYVFSSFRSRCFSQLIIPEGFLHLLTLFPYASEHLVSVSLRLVSSSHLYGSRCLWFLSHSYSSHLFYFNKADLLSLAFFFCHGLSEGISYHPLLLLLLLHSRLSQPLPSVRCFPQQSHQLLMNLYLRVQCTIRTVQAQVDLVSMGHHHSKMNNQFVQEGWMEV